MASSDFRHFNSLGRCAIPVLEAWPVAFAVAAVLGFLAGLGVGGGSLLVLWLTLVLGMDHPKARIINLMFFIPCAIISCLFRWKHGSLNFKKILPAIVAGCISAGAFSFFSRHLELDALKKLFGILLLITGIRELFYKPKNK